MMYSLDEIGILPSGVPSLIEHRGDIDISVPGQEKGWLPVFVSPMTCVVDTANYVAFEREGFIPIIPRRTEDLSERLVLCNEVWCAFSLSEFEKFFCEETDSDECPLVLIDVANGHMKKVYDLVRIAKKCWKNITIMVGNIAHPDMYWECYNAGVDYVRVSIGSGSVCSTGIKTGIHASMPWLLGGIRKIQDEIRLVPQDKPFPKVIADGGINTLDRAIKCLALGADYVMWGKLFAQCKEACGPTELDIPKECVDDYVRTASRMTVSQLEVLQSQFPRKRKYYGMASYEGQKDISSDKTIKSEEGISIYVPVKYTTEYLASEFISSLRSAMSYTNCKDLNAFKHVKTEIMSPLERAAYYKSDENSLLCS